MPQMAIIEEKSVCMNPKIMQCSMWMYCTLTPVNSWNTHKKIHPPNCAEQGTDALLLDRVQWFWHFFRNSICFMCFWFGLEKKFFKIVRKGYQKSGILHWFKKCAEVLSLAKGKTVFYRKTYFSGTFAKKRFSEKKSLETSWYKRCAHFLNQPKIPLLLIPFCAQFWGKKFSTLIRDGAIILEVKRSNKKETVQY